MPGVPPNAIVQAKGFFKNLLRPGKKRKEQEQQAQAAQQQNEQANAAIKSDAPSKIPPTHPLATGQHSEPQTALPKPGSAVAPAVVAGNEGAVKGQVNKQGEDKAPVSPATPAPTAKDEAHKSEPVSAVSTEHDNAVPLPKSDSANDIQAAAPLTSQPTTQVPAAASENAKPNATAPATATAPTTAATAPTPTTETQPAAKTSSESARDEKMPVMAEEPPVIKAKAAAPGMSATSGPLDDFPIEDDKP